MKNKVKEVYDRMSKYYESEAGPFNSEYERPAMLNLLPNDLAGKRILDAGCTAGWYTYQCINRGADVTAIDLSPKMVLATKRLVGDRAEVFCANLEDKLPFEDDSFDLIVSSLVLHYIKDWEKTFYEFQRVLKPNGNLLFSVHHPFMDFKLSVNGHYFDTEYIIDEWVKKGKVFKVPFFRRPLQEIINTTARYFLVEKIVEPQPTEQFKIIDIKKYERLMKNPHFLIVNAVKRSSHEVKSR